MELAGLHGKRTAKAGNYKCPLGVLLAWDRWKKVSNDRVVCHLLAGYNRMPDDERTRHT